MTIIRSGIDLAKNSFSLCGVDEREQIILEKTVKRKALLECYANLPSCRVAMEAGSGAHHWARELKKLGHIPCILDPAFVAPYRTGGRSRKNDANDARAICEASGRPGVRFVPVKSLDQQAILLVHRRRNQVVTEHTRTANQIRGFLAEFGVVAPTGVARLKQNWLSLRQKHHADVPIIAWEEIDALYTQLHALHQQVLAYDRKIHAFVRDDARAERLTHINGVGVITASAIVATVGDARLFKNGRQFAAWLGLTPRQYSTGGKPRLGRISKRGDRYLRTLLVHGARSELRYTPTRKDAKSQWVEHLRQSKSWNKTAVALANKHARIIWSMLAREQGYQPA